MFDLIKTQWVGIVAVALLAFVIFTQGGDTVQAPDNLGGTLAITQFTNPIRFAAGMTDGGDACTLTDANGGAYVLTDAQTAICKVLTFAAGGAGQAVVSLTLPATSTMTNTIPKAGDCKSLYYSAINLSAATTTTILKGAGHNVVAYTTADDVIDGTERAQITMCRLTSGDVDTYTTEILNAD